MEELRPIKLSAISATNSKIELTIPGDSDIFEVMDAVVTLLRGVSFLECTIIEGMESYIKNYKDIKSVDENND